MLPPPPDCPNYFINSIGVVVCLNSSQSSTSNSPTFNFPVSQPSKSPNIPNIFNTPPTSDSAYTPSSSVTPHGFLDKIIPLDLLK